MDGETENDESSEKQIEEVTRLGYEVRFQDYALYYLIDTKEKTVSIMQSNDTYVGLYDYTGDLNNGIYFDQDGLKGRIYYHYWDNKNSIIIKDESGNENKGIYIGVDLLPDEMK